VRRTQALLVQSVRPTFSADLPICRSPCFRVSHHHIPERTWARPQRNRRVVSFQLSLNSEVEEGFLHSGTAKSAAPPVGMTIFGWWMKWENPTSAKLDQSTGID